MKTNRPTNLCTALFSLVAFASAGCAEKERVAEAPLPPAKVVATTAPTAPVPVAAAAIPDAAAQWTDIKDCTYAMRAQFFTGLKRLEGKVDGQISELTAKRATMTGTTGTKEWDFAMKEMGESRSYLKSMGEELTKATSETWSQGVDKVGQAWVRTQDAYSKVKASTTI